MASKVSKNQRTAKAPTGPLIQTGDQKVLVPLNGGKHAYVRGAGKSLHVATDSPAFAAAISQLGVAAKADAELQILDATYPDHGWGATRTRLMDENVL